MQTRVKEMTTKSGIVYEVQLNRFLWDWEFLTSFRNKDIALRYSNSCNERHEKNKVVKEAIFN